LNECRKDSFDGPLKKAEGIARVVDNTTNSKLEVKFFLFWGNYWIIDLDEEYRFAVVSEPRQKYLWILSRTPIMKEDIYQGILTRLKEKGFDLTRLKMTPQPLPG
jgi:apolipoprotein D and lipocalin family protein